MIVRSVLGLGKSLDIPVLAEGVETREQLEFLRSENARRFRATISAARTPLRKFARRSPAAQTLAELDESPARAKLTTIAGGKGAA